MPRDQLTAEQQAEIGPWCRGGYVEPARPGMDDRTPADEAPTYASADSSSYDQRNERTVLQGDVVLRQAGLQAEAQTATLDQQTGQGELEGQVRLRDRGMLVLGDRAELQLDSGQARVDNAEYVMHPAHARGTALYATRDENAVIRLKDGTYTSCEPGENTWELRGNNVTLNPATGFGTATNVTLRVKDIPVFYTPYIYFPIDDRRQSGFLPPSLSSTDDSGIALQTPYYFNLAPNYDATLYPRYMTERGLQMEGEFRYLTRDSRGQMGAAWLDDENDDRRLQSEHEATRWGFRMLVEMECCDILQPDVGWCGGITELLKISGLADAHGRLVVPHGSSVYSYHFVITRHNSPFAEFLMMAPAADTVVPMFSPQLLDEPVPVNGRIKASALDAPGFGVRLNPECKLHRPYPR